MKRFEFTLETLLQLKKLREQEKLNQLSEITSRIAQYETEIRRNREDVQRLLREESEKNRRGEFDLQQALAYRRYFAGLRMRAQIAERKIAELQGELQKRTALWNKAQVERRAVELVKERQYAEYLVEARRAEAQEMDEFNSRKYKQLYH